jgi:cytochrome P450 family 110
VSRLPPGPGNALLATIRYLRDPFGSLLRAAERFGDPYTWPTFLGKVVITGDPVGLKTLLSADPDIYQALGADLLGPVLGENNLILLSGERHRAMRKLQNPQFHGERLRAYGQIITTVAETHIGRWPTEKPFPIQETMQAISLDVILEAVLGLGEPTGRAAFKQAVLEVVAALKPSFMFWPALRRPMLGLSAWARFQRKRSAAAALFKEELATRRARPDVGEDILSLMVASRKEDGTAFDDDELLEQMMSLIGAGHETTASALTWALYHIYRDPRVKARLLAELSGNDAPRDPEAVTRLPYLDAVCSEALRLNPVAPLVGRTLRQSLTLQGYDLPAGVSVGIGIVNVHRRPDLYPEPEQFRPERFIERGYSAFEYLPFGGGSRRCLGAAFAVYEMKLVLATVLRTEGLRLITDAPVRAALRNTTVGPAATIEMARS